MTPLLLCLCTFFFGWDIISLSVSLCLNTGFNPCLRHIFPSLSVVPLMYGRLIIFLLAVLGGGVQSSVTCGSGCSFGYRALLIILSGCPFLLKASSRSCLPVSVGPYHTHVVLSPADS